MLMVGQYFLEKRFARGVGDRARQARPGTVPAPRRVPAVGADLDDRRADPGPHATRR